MQQPPSGPTLLPVIPLQESVAQLRDVTQRFEDFVVLQLAELEALGLRLDDRDRELVEVQQQVDELQQLNELRAIEFAERTDRAEQLAAELDQVRAELDRLGEAAGRPRPEELELSRRLHELEQQQILLRAERDASAARMQDTDQLVEELRGELTVARDELLRDRAAAATSHADVDRRLHERLRDLERQRDALQAELAETRGRASQLDETASELEQTRDELAQVRGQLLKQRETTVAGQADLQKKHKQQLADVQRERDELRSELTIALGEASEAASLTVELEQARQALEQSKSELAQLQQSGAGQRGDSRRHKEQIQQGAAERDALRGELAAAQARLADFAGTANDVAAVRDEAQRQMAELAAEREAFGAAAAQLGELERHVAALEAERDAMQGQLEAVLSRATDMAESHARELRQAVSERAEWEAEMKTLRRALLTQHADAPPRKPPRKPVPVAAVPQGDPVLSAVAAQFARLKRDPSRTAEAGRASA